MNSVQLGPLPEGSIVPTLARAIADAGGRLLIVGGWVRDQLRLLTGTTEAQSKDLDLEIFGLAPEIVSEVLEPFGSIGQVGRQFPVWRLAHQDLDISFPRAGALDYQGAPRGGDRIDAAHPTLREAFAKAARHRDLTINAMAWDPLDGALIDPWGGQKDLEARRLRAVDIETFGCDALRGLRVARLVAQLEATVAPTTTELCQRLDWSHVPIERQASELRRILLEPRRPSLAFEWAAEAQLLHLFPLIDALRGTPQDPHWHPEGDVFVHTCMVIDRAREIGQSLPLQDREALQWAALCHDLGKPTTTTEEAGRIRSLQHDRVGAAMASDWLLSLRVGKALKDAVEVLVGNHLAPSQFVAQGAKPRAYRRLARRLARGRMTVVDLERLARADHLGRTTDDARSGRFEAGERFLALARREGLLDGPRPDVLTSEHLFARGFEPGPRLGAVLDRARELQDDHGWDDPDRLLEAARSSLAETISE